jgi:nucleoporin NDC1
LANVLQAFAFWELVYISQRFEGRRKAIFEDIDRKGGSTWSQLLVICLEVVNGIASRINEYEDPTVKPAGEIKPKPEDVPGLPRLSQPIKDGLKGPGDLFTKPRKAISTGAGVAEVVGNFAKSHGQSPLNNLSPRSKKLREKAENAILTKEQKDAVAAGGIGALFKEWALWVIRSPIGFPFRQEYRRRIEAVVLGSPYGDVGIIVDAIDSLTGLAICSLKEDKFGNVQRDVKTIIQTFTVTILRIEGFKKSIGFHWTDIEKKQQSEAVETILAALKGGLKDLIDEFGGFSQDLKLSQSELRTAREASAAPLIEAIPEMEMRR